MESLYIVGAGGIGCAIGYALRAAGSSVVMVERNAAKIESGRRDGIAVAGRSSISADFVSFDNWSPPAGATVILCTKCYDNAAILEHLPRSVNLIPIQNGFDPQLLHREHAFEGIASFISECEPERPATRITRKGRLHLGPRTAATKSHATIQALAADLRKSRLFRVVGVPAIEPYKYTKLMYNAAISPLAAAAGIDNGKLLSLPETRRLFFAFILENYGILSGAGIALGKVGPFQPSTVAAILKRRWIGRLMAWAFEPSLRGTYCSMAADLPRGITEIDYYNQRLIDVAGNRPCPLNRAAVKLIKRMERERIAPHRDSIGAFTDALEGSATNRAISAHRIVQ
jgi:2-dehydropantoate 2-reductase